MEFRHEDPRLLKPIRAAWSKHLRTLSPSKLEVLAAEGHEEARRELARRPLTDMPRRDVMRCRTARKLFAPRNKIIVDGKPKRERHYRSGSFKEWLREYPPKGPITPALARKAGIP